MPVLDRADDPQAAPHHVGDPLRVLVVDDHPAVRSGVQQLLDEQADMTVVGAVESAEAALIVAEHEPLDVAVIDYQLGGHTGLWLSRKLKRRSSRTRVVIYSAYCDGPLSAACVVAEADGLVSKSAVGTELCDALRRVAGGASLLPFVAPTLAEAMRRRFQPEDQAIFGLLLAGVDRVETARTLRLEPEEVDARMWVMLRTLEGLGLQARTTLARPAPRLAHGGYDEPGLEHASGAR